MSINPMHKAHAATRCQAKSKRSGKPCRAPAVRGVCRMHGARGGAPVATDYESGGQEFESLRARQQTPTNPRVFRSRVSHPSLGNENERDTISRNQRAESRKIPEVVHRLFAPALGLSERSKSVVLTSGKRSRFYFRDFYRRARGTSHYLMAWAGA